jgi:hypothetical protein
MNRTQGPQSLRLGRVTPVCKLVDPAFAPEEQLILARPFSAGWGIHKDVCVPSGRLKACREVGSRVVKELTDKRRKATKAGCKGLLRYPVSGVSTGRNPFFKMPHPALKGRAKINCPSGAKTSMRPARLNEPEKGFRVRICMTE